MVSEIAPKSHGRFGFRLRAHRTLFAIFVPEQKAEAAKERFGGRISATNVGVKQFAVPVIPERFSGFEKQRRGDPFSLVARPYGYEVDIR